MAMNHLLRGKKILVVDDEPDILETLEEVLDSCCVTTAGDFESARRLLINEPFDAAILDIMGVNGYDLLNLAKAKGMPVLMLTAHALSPDHLEKSIRSGACCYLPKDEMVNIGEHLLDAFAAEARDGEASHPWFDKLTPYFDKKWGSQWKRDRMETLRRLNLVHSQKELEDIL